MEDKSPASFSLVGEVRTNGSFCTQAKNSGNKETIRRGALMKMLLNCAQTLPLWIGNFGEKPPPLCGAVAPEQNYVAKVCGGVYGWVYFRIPSL